MTYVFISSEASTFFIYEKSDYYKPKVSVVRMLWNEYRSHFAHAIFSSPVPKGFVLWCPPSELCLLFQCTFVIHSSAIARIRGKCTKSLVHKNSLMQLEQWMSEGTAIFPLPATQLVIFLLCVTAGPDKRGSEWTKNRVHFHFEPRSDPIQVNGKFALDFNRSQIGCLNTCTLGVRVGVGNSMEGNDENKCYLFLDVDPFSWLLGCMHII